MYFYANLAMRQQKAKERARKRLRETPRISMSSSLGLKPHLVISTSPRQPSFIDNIFSFVAGIVMSDSKSAVIEEPIMEVPPAPRHSKPLTTKLGSQMQSQGNGIKVTVIPVLPQQQNELQKFIKPILEKNKTRMLFNKLKAMQGAITKQYPLGTITEENLSEEVDTPSRLSPK
jgi:hypothetical protein